MFTRQDLHDAWLYVLAIAPAPVGALIGLRYAAEQTPRARAVTWLSCCGLGVIAGPWLGDLLGLSPSGVAVATLVTASVGMELMAGLHTAARAFAGDPLGFLGKALSLWRKGGES
jgi:hypothetical protein